MIILLKMINFMFFVNIIFLTQKKKNNYAKIIAKIKNSFIVTVVDMKFVNFAKIKKNFAYNVDKK